MGYGFYFNDSYYAILGQLRSDISRWRVVDRVCKFSFFGEEDLSGLNKKEAKAFEFLKKKITGNARNSQSTGVASNVEFVRENGSFRDNHKTNGETKGDNFVIFDEKNTGNYNNTEETGGEVIDNFDEETGGEVIDNFDEETGGEVVDSFDGENIGEVVDSFDEENIECIDIGEEKIVNVLDNFNEGNEEYCRNFKDEDKKVVGKNEEKCVENLENSVRGVESETGNTSKDLVLGEEDCGAFDKDNQEIVVGGGVTLYNEDKFLGSENVVESKKKVGNFRPLTVPEIVERGNFFNEVCKNGQKRAKTGKNGQEWAKTGKNGQKRAKSVTYINKNPYKIKINKIYLIKKLKEKEYKEKEKEESFESESGSETLKIESENGNKNLNLESESVSANLKIESESERENKNESEIERGYKRASESEKSEFTFMDEIGNGNSGLVIDERNITRPIYENNNASGESVAGGSGGLEKSEVELSDIEKYITENSLFVDAKAFYYFYKSKGWKVGGSKLVDWRAKCKEWHYRKMVERDSGQSFEKSGKRTLFSSSEFRSGKKIDSYRCGSERDYSGVDLSSMFCNLDDIEI